MSVSKLQKLINSGWTIILSRNDTKEVGEMLLFPGSKASVVVQTRDEIIIDRGEDVQDVLEKNLGELFHEEESSVILRPDRIRENGSLRFTGEDVQLDGNDTYSEYIINALTDLREDDDFDVESIEESNQADDDLLEDDEVFQCLADLESELGLIASERYLEIKALREDGVGWEEISELAGAPEEFLKCHYLFLLNIHDRISRARKNLDGNESL